jgi:hypothetical protein
MRKRIINGLILVMTLSIMISCSTNPTAKIQGVFEVDKESLKNSLQLEMEGENAFAIGLLNVALENAVIEFCIKGDSINRILFMAGETTLLESKIIERNDSLIISAPDFEAHIIPTETGLTYSAVGSDMTLELNKTDRTDLSSDTKKTIEAQKVAIKEKEEFEQNLGKWQEGNYVDEFGDKTGDGFAYCLIRGTSENSISTQNEVYVKAMVQSGKLYFQIYNSSFSMKESFPDSEFGRMKLKFPDGKVESERVLFYDNSVSESGDKAILFDYISKNDGLVKVFIDLSTASNYYSDKYQFAIEKNNLTEILAGLK